MLLMCIACAVAGDARIRCRDFKNKNRPAMNQRSHWLGIRLLPIWNEIAFAVSSKNIDREVPYKFRAREEQARAAGKWSSWQHLSAKIPSRAFYTICVEKFWSLVLLYLFGLLRSGVYLHLTHNQLPSIIWTPKHHLSINTTRGLGFRGWVWVLGGFWRGLLPIVTPSSNCFPQLD